MEDPKTKSSSPPQHEALDPKSGHKGGEGQAQPLNQAEANREEQLDVQRRRSMATLPKQSAAAKKKNAGLIRLVGAPVIDVIEAKKMMLEQEAIENQQDGEPKAADAAGEGADLESPRVPSSDDGEYLDAANEETFTLETFESLVRGARAANKTFILARVTTVDPSNLTRLYFSYYAAHHINRVIFRTQPEEGLLHRMKSRNPLNNMLIVGDVHYFVIRPEEFDRAWAERQVQLERQNVLRSSVPGDSGAAAASMDAARSRDTLLVRRESSLSMPETTLGGEEDTTVPPIYEAEFYATDDDFLMRAEIREFFKLNSVSPDDYQLFQLNRRSDLPYDLTVLGPDGRPLAHGTQPVGPRPRGWRRLWGLLSSGPRRAMAFELPTAVISPGGFWLTTLLATTATVLAILLFLPADLFVIVIAAFVSLIVVDILFFVDWHDHQ